ncbi:MAG: hypothetical protein AB7D57_04845 [Desulfovibrionaceae bacterium]
METVILGLVLALPPLLLAYGRDGRRGRAALNPECLGLGLAVLAQAALLALGHAVMDHAVMSHAIMDAHALQVLAN